MGLLLALFISLSAAQEMYRCKFNQGQCSDVCYYEKKGNGNVEVSCRKDNSYPKKIVMNCDTSPSPASTAGTFKTPGTTIKTTVKTTVDVGKRYVRAKRSIPCKSCFVLPDMDTTNLGETLTELPGLCKPKTTPSRKPGSGSVTKSFTFLVISAMIVVIIVI